MNTEDSETNEPNNFVINFSQRLNLSSSDKYVTLQNHLFITLGKI